MTTLSHKALQICKLRICSYDQILTITLLINCKNSVIYGKMTVNYKEILKRIGPWTSGYWEKLHFKRSWVRIQHRTQDDNLLCIFCLKKEKEAEWFITKARLLYLNEFGSFLQLFRSGFELRIVIVNELYLVPRYNDNDKILHLFTTKQIKF